jgi:hypothetical protein
MYKYSQIRKVKRVNGDKLGRFCEHVLVNYIECYRQLGKVAVEGWQNY